MLFQEDIQSKELLDLFKIQMIIEWKQQKKITEAAGGKLIDMMTLRGAYDFIAIIEGSDFELQLE